MVFKFLKVLLCLVYASVFQGDQVSAFIWRPPPSCELIHEYNALMSNLQKNPCISDTQIWHKLVPLQAKSHTCLRQLISNMADNHDHYLECVIHNSNCEFWTHLRDIKNGFRLDQQSEMILHLSHTYSNGHENVCKCHKADTHVEVKTTTPGPLLVKSSLPTKTTVKHHITTSPTTPSTRNPIAIATTNSIPIYSATSSGVTPADKLTSAVFGATAATQTLDQTTQSNNSPLHLSTNCQKYWSVSNIAVAEVSSHPMAYLCPSGNRTSNEAFVLVNCNVGSPENWIEGPSVMKNCDRIPNYTPVASFGTQYLGVHEHQGLSGIFLGCIPGGFKMAYQDCDTSATIKHVGNGTGTGTDDPLILGVLSSLRTSSAFFLWPSRTNAPKIDEPPCESVGEYLVLRQAISSQPCISNTQIWSLLEPVAKHQHACLGRAILEISAYIDAALNHGESCQCNGDFQKNVMNPVGNGHDHYGECLYGNPGCQYLYDYFYLRIRHYNEKSQCQTHHHVWKHLRDIHNVGGDLQADMVLHLSLTYSNGRENTCFCKSNQPSTPEPSTSSVTSSISTSSTAQSTSTRASLQSSTTNSAVSLSFPKCKKYELVSDIAKGQYESHPEAQQCSSGNRTSHEAFTMANCDVGPPHLWEKGDSVMSKCDTLPSYTPIAALKSNSTGVPTVWELSGIFMGCVSGGFKMSYQDCNTKPTIVHIETGNGTGKHDPYNYFVILKSI